MRKLFLVSFDSLLPDRCFGCREMYMVAFENTSCVRKMLQMEQFCYFISKT